MIRFLALPVFLAIIIGCSGPLAAEFRVGTAHRVVTPDPLLPVSGGEVAGRGDETGGRESSVDSQQALEARQESHRAGEEDEGQG